MKEKSISCTYIDFVSLQVGDLLKSGDKIYKVVGKTENLEVFFDEVEINEDIDVTKSIDFDIRGGEIRDETYGYRRDGKWMTFDMMKKREAFIRGDEYHDVIEQMYFAGGAYSKKTRCWKNGKIELVSEKKLKNI